MKSKLSQIIFSFITGAALSHTGEPLPKVLNEQHQVLLDKDPEVIATKLTPDQLKDVLDLKLAGFDAYLISVQNDSRRSYSLTTSSIDANCIDAGQSQKILAKKGKISVQVIGGVCGLYFMPIGFATNIYSMVMSKKSKIFQGKLEAMLLDKEVISSYSSLSRLVLIKSEEEIKDKKIDLIDLQTMKAKTVIIN